MILISPFEESDVSIADPLVGIITRSLNYLKVEFYEKLLVSVGEKGAVKQNQRAMKQAYQIGLRLK